MGPITLDELRHALMRIISGYQAFYGITATCARLRRLRPFLDDAGVVRIQGRLRRATNLPYAARHPAILPASSHLTTLSVRSCHNSNGHAPEAHTLAQLRFSGLWILQGRTSVKRALHGCVDCRQMRGRPAEQIMADLPRAAAEASHCFDITGTDVLGPFYVKFGRGTTKKWLVNFTCRTFRAIHLEVIESMDTSSMICAIRRFIARRGAPSLIISDVGTNYVGVASELDILLSKIDRDSLKEYALQEGFSWQFTAAKASHHMGFVERLNASIRRALYGLSHERTYKSEVFTTLACQVEQILNSRPLVAMSANVDDLEPLTPSHLLLLRPNAHKPLVPESDASLHAIKWYKSAENLAAAFKQRFIKEYLPTLQGRQK